MGGRHTPDTLISQLNHCDFLIPQAQHFMGRIRTVKHAASKRRFARLSPDVQLDLNLWLSFLASAGAGISMNNLTFRHPTHISRVDASEHRIGGYSLLSGQAWLFEIPVDLLLRGSLNSLEHLTSYLQLAFEVAMTSLLPSSVILPGRTAQPRRAGSTIRASMIASPAPHHSASGLLVRPPNSF
jgi:hypothetical protein